MKTEFRAQFFSHIFLLCISLCLTRQSKYMYYYSPSVDNGSTPLLPSSASTSSLSSTLPSELLPKDALVYFISRAHDLGILFQHTSTDKKSGDIEAKPNLTVSVSPPAGVLNGAEVVSSAYMIIQVKISCSLYFFDYVQVKISFSIFFWFALAIQFNSDIFLRIMGSLRCAKAPLLSTLCSRKTCRNSRGRVLPELRLLTFGRLRRTSCQNQRTSLKYDSVPERGRARRRSLL